MTCEVSFPSAFALPEYRINSELLGNEIIGEIWREISSDVTGIASLVDLVTYISDNGFALREEGTRIVPFDDVNYLLNIEEPPKEIQEITDQ